MRRIATILTVLLLTACSTTKVLEPGEYRLAQTRIMIDPSYGITENELVPYIKQQGKSGALFGWSPLMSVYNWSAGKDSGLSKVFKKIGIAPVVFKENLVDDSCNSIGHHLEYLGYYGSSVYPVITCMDRKAYVDYYVTPGKQYRINSVTYDLPESDIMQAEFFADSVNFTVRPGGYLSEKDLEDQASESAAYFRNLGYYGFTSTRFSFEADTLSSDGVELALKLDSDTLKYKFGKVSITHPASISFNKNVLKQMNLIEPGAYYNEQVLDLTYRRMAQLRVFNGVAIELEPSTEREGLIDCNINLSQSKVKGVKFNFESSVNSSGLLGVSPQLAFYHKNLFHGGEWLTLNFSGNYQWKPQETIHAEEFGASASLSLPRFLGLPADWFDGAYIPRTEFNLSYNFQSRPEFTRNVASFSYGYSGNIDNRFIYQLYPLKWNYVELGAVSADFDNTLEKNPFIRYSYQDHLDMGIGGLLYYTTCHEIVPKVPYWYVNFNFDISGNVLSAFNTLMPCSTDGKRLLLGVPYSQYVRGELSYGKTFRFGKHDKQSLAFRVLGGAGYAYGNSSVLPFEKQFYVGGSSSLRGWQARSIGPGNDPMSTLFSIPSQTGDLKFEANAEYRFPLISVLEGALFIDAGNVWNSAEFRMTDLATSIAADWGIGLRLNLDFILMRLDCGFKTFDPSRSASDRWLTPSEMFASDGFALHFGVGYPF